MSAINAVSSSHASVSRSLDAPLTALCTNAVRAVSLVAMPRRSRSRSALRTPLAVSPATLISWSVETPLSGGA